MRPSPRPRRARLAGAARPARPASSARAADAAGSGDLEAGRAARAESLRFYTLAEAEFRQASEIRPEDVRLRRKLREVRVERARVARETLALPAPPAEP